MKATIWNALNYTERCFYFEKPNDMLSHLFEITLYVLQLGRKTVVKFNSSVLDERFCSFYSNLAYKYSAPTRLASFQQNNYKSPLFCAVGGRKGASCRLCLYHGFEINIPRISKFSHTDWRLIIWMLLSLTGLIN